VPLNSDAIDVLKAWQPEASTNASESTRVVSIKRPKRPARGLVFPGDDGERMGGLKTAFLAIVKAAKIADFRFHDLRHTFASKLVQAGVDLNTVRELLGHADLKMTLRYSHLAPEHKAAAVAKLVRA
jgi:integrase